MLNPLGSLDEDVTIIIIITVIALGIVALLAVYPLSGNHSCVGVSIGGGAEITHPIPNYTHPIQLDPDLVNATLDVRIKIEAKDTVKVGIWSNHGLVYQDIGKSIDMRKTISGVNTLIIIVEPYNTGGNLSDLKIEYLIESQC